MANVFFTADTHFGHTNVIKFCARPFASDEEMDEALIENWNAKVKGCDTVFVLGDMFYRCENVAEILRRLKGKKHLILGNHDSSWMDKVNLEDYFIGVDRIFDLSDGKRGVNMGSVPEEKLMKRVAQIGGGKILGSEEFVRKWVFGLGHLVSSKSAGAHKVGEIGYSSHGWKLEKGKKAA